MNLKIIQITNMKKINNIFRYSLLSLLALVVSVGCQKEMMGMPSIPSKKQRWAKKGISLGLLSRLFTTAFLKSSVSVNSPQSSFNIACKESALFAMSNSNASTMFF